MRQSQPIDAAQVEGYSAQFQRRWEAGYHWRSMCSMLLGTPGLRAAWPMSVVDYQRSECTDISGHGYDLQSAAALGNVTFGYDPNGIAPMALFAGGANQYLSRVDGGAGNWADILGTEAHIIAAERGLSIGGWFWWPALPNVIQYLMAKDDAVAQRQYALLLINTNNVEFIVWPGAIVINSAATINTGWNHCFGIYDQASQDLHVVLNGVVTTNAGAAPAALADSTSPFTIGGDGAGGNRFTGYASDCALNAASIGRFIIASYHYTKAAYGVK